MKPQSDPKPPFAPLVVIPCLNEADHIERVALQMSRAIEGSGGLVVIADGGSTDGTVRIAADIERRMANVVRLHNPARLQGPGINAAVRRFGTGRTHLVRVDAHCAYPDGFIEALRREAEATGAASVVVGMIARGEALLQRINASTQNARIGNGGSAHRSHGDGRFVEHGHHALMRLDAFTGVDGYDESFSHNEDAELDYRLGQAGHRIWLTARTHVVYYPRTSLAALARQYFNYGQGRARNLLKHGARPKLRQCAVIAVAPVMLLATSAPVLPVLAGPALIWALAGLLGGAALAAGRRDPVLVLAGPIALLMHLAWSVGFWRQALAKPLRPLREAAT